MIPFADSPLIGYIIPTTQDIKPKIGDKKIKGIKATRIQDNKILSVVVFNKMLMNSNIVIEKIKSFQFNIDIDKYASKHPIETLRRN